jgi:Rrf2 family protein
MRLSAKAQYACIAMLELAGAHPDAQLVQVKTIAEVHGISQRFLVQILLQLKVHGLVRSTRGAAGGYQLARRPEATSLADIIHAIDQPAPPASPVLAGLHPSGAVQALGSVLQDLDAREKQMLRGITLADLLRRAEQPGVSTYQI